MIETLKGRIVFLMAVATAIVSMAATKPARADGKFYLHNGDRVVFYGDSITEQRLYTTYVESYCVTRFPHEHFTFIHSGWGGDRVTGGGGGPIDTRLQRDVVAYHPTVVTIDLAMNDGGYQPFNTGLFRVFVQGYRHIIDVLERDLPGVRITLLEASPFDDVTRAPSFAGGYNAVLEAYGDAVAELGREYHLTVVDLNAPLVGALARALVADPSESQHIIPDRVHPQAGGHAIMAAALLEGWNAPALVANTHIDAASARAISAEGTSIYDVSFQNNKLRFRESDHCLPWPLDTAAGNPDMALAMQCSPFERDLNEYRLQVTGLPQSVGSWQIVVDGKPAGEVSRQDLERGVSLTSFPDLPANQQAAQVLALTRKHNDIHWQRWRVVQTPHAVNGVQVDAATQAEMDRLDAQENDVVVQQRAAALPVGHNVTLQPAPAAAG
ncbi:MAG: GDSL family lipase [Armatimonadetes bacterium]|nr:GDSL family lipase [Armatimonadota bacterium]MDE2206950.1 GDSL family lipase [Armatimonadota bacterium]